MSTTRRISVRSFDGFQFSIGCNLLTSALLRRLFNITERGPLALIDVQNLDVVSEDVGTGLFPSEAFDGGATVFQVVPESVIDESDEEEQTKYMPPPPGSARRPISAARVACVKGAVRAYVLETYEPVHAHLFRFDESYLEPDLVAAIKRGDIGYFTKQTQTGLYTGKILTDIFCREFVEEIENFERSGMPLSRPNSMNNFGLILQDVGLDDMAAELLMLFLAPLGAALYPSYEPAQSLDSMHSFIVQYKLSEDRSLDFHHDDSHVTVNVCLGKEFKGGDLYFRGLLHDPETQNESVRLNHTPGYGCIHLGQHRHGAEPITEGERYNLILWCRSHTHYEQHGHANPMPGHDHHDHDHDHVHHTHEY